MASLLAVVAVVVISTIVAYRHLRAEEIEGVARLFRPGWTPSNANILVGGAKGDNYYDMDRALSSSGTAIADWYVEALANIKEETGGIDRIAFIEKDSGPVGALAMKELLVREAEIPAIIIRSRRRVLFACCKGSFQIAEHPLIVVVSDVITTGGTVAKAVKKLKDVGAKVVAVVVIYNRGGEKVLERFKNEGIKLYYFIDAASVADRGLNVSNPQAKVLPENWAS